MLLVVGQVVPTDYFKPIVTERVSDRMRFLRQSVLSTTRLQPLVRRLGLARNGKTEETAIEEIQNNLLVARAGKPVSTEGEGRGATADVPGFYVLYTADNRQDAEQVCSEVTSMLLADNVELRGQAARSTTDFLSLQLEQSKRNLDEMDKKLAEFRHEHMGRLPGDADNDFRILASLQSQLEASTGTLNRLQQNKAELETLLDKELAVIKSAQAAPIYNPVRQQLMKLLDQLVLLQTKYTDEHPDVIKTKHEIAELQAQLAKMDAEADQSDELRNATVPRTGIKLEPSEIVRLRQAIVASDKAMDRVTKGQQKLSERIDLYQERLALSPSIEEEYKQLTRDNATAHNLYNTLLANKSTAEMQTEMEVRQQGEQLKLLDPARAPKSPSYPVRWKFGIYGLGGGLCLGVGAALWLELQDKSIRDEGDVLAALELPMLAQMPWAGAQENGSSWTNKFGHRVTGLLERDKARQD